MKRKQIFKNNFRKKVAYLLSNEDEGKIGFLNLRQVFRVDREEWKVKRCPEYDQFAKQGYVPIQRLLDDGWEFGCWECEKRVDAEAWDYEEDCNLNLVVTEHSVFCCPECHHTYTERIAHHKSLKEKWGKFLSDNYPGISKIGYHFRDNDVVVDFNLPGFQYSCRWVSYSPSAIIYRAADEERMDEYLRRVKK